MGNFKGTKGKWYRNKESRIVSSVYSENNEKLIHISGKNNEEAQANALLISKAPEMLGLLDRFATIRYKGASKKELEELFMEAEELIKSATEL